MSNILEKVQKLNPLVEISEIVGTDGDYAMVVGRMGQDDTHHYLITNLKYGVIEGSSGILPEAEKILEFCLGRKMARTAVVPSKAPDFFN